VADKPTVWLKTAIRTPPFSEEARIDAGALLRRLQRGDSLGMPHSRPMPTIGARCHELRIVDRTKSWRIIYRVDTDAIVIVDVFEKKTQKTPKDVLDRCRKRLKTYDAVQGDEP
jgi:phage-related protein